jgi:outer membrane protein assembly factor BamB
MPIRRVLLAIIAACAATTVTIAGLSANQAAAAKPFPVGPLVAGTTNVVFAPDGSFTLTGFELPRLTGTYKTTGNEIELVLSPAPANCTESGKYRFTVEGRRVSFTRISDTCPARWWVFDDSTWLPPGEKFVAPPRRIVTTNAATRRPLPRRTSSQGSWPSFRGTEAAGVGDGQKLPDAWNVERGENILWKTDIPGLAHSSPVVWGDTVFVATAVSSAKDASFRPGLYGAGDPSEDRSRHQWKIIAINKKTGAILWDRTAVDAVPIDKRHIKSTYASATPATDGRVVVASFGSQGVFAYDVHGNFRWKVDYGRAHLGAYNVVSLEWGPASSPFIWNDLVLVQVDTHTDSFLMALNIDDGRMVWKVDRDELPSWGTPTVATTPAGPVLVTNASNFVRAYDPLTGKELWRIGKSSKITAPTPIFAEGLFVIASGRAPERPIFVVKPSARGDITLKDGETSSANVAWSNGKGSYMPTPLAYQGLLYVLANGGIFDAYDLQTGKEIYRQRLPLIGSGYSASPIAADGKIYLSNEDGDMLVVAAGATFSHISTNAMGDLLMATPALSDGVMYVRGSKRLVAIGTKRSQ